MTALDLSRAARRGAGLVAALAIASAPAARAQAPGFPVLTSAFPAPGLAAGINVGRASGRTTVLGAVGFGPRNERLHLDLGGGVQTGSAAGYKGSPATYGGRLSARVLTLATERVAVTPFFGFGSTRARVANTTLAGLPVVAADSGKTLETDVIPLGASVGARVALGATGALAVSVAPFYAWYRQTGLSTDATRGRVRFSGLVEVAFAERFAVVAGLEAGQTSDGGRPGPAGASTGIGVGYHFGGH